MCTRIGQVGFAKVLRRRAAQATQGRAEIVAQICAMVRSGAENSGVVELRAPLRREAPWSLRGRWNIGIDKAMVRVSFQAGLRRYLAEVMLG